MFRYLNQDNIFILDGVGAFLSAMLTGLVLPLFSQQIGLPIEILYQISIFPVLFAVFSFGCVVYAKNKKSWMLKGIMFANVIYCVVSGSLAILYNGIQPLGQALFFLEILLVLGVVRIEFQIHQKYFTNSDPA